MNTLDIDVASGTHQTLNVRDTVRVSVAADASVEIMPQGSTQLEVHLIGRGARVRIHSALRLQGDDTCTHGVKVVHTAPDTHSQQVFRCVSSDASRYQVESDVLIERGACGSHSRQELRGLLLSDRTRQDLRPGLAVFEDDLLGCSHGATTGALNEDHLRYLCMRGLNTTQAHEVLIEAFLADGVEAML